MSQASTPLVGQSYFMGNHSVGKLSAGQWVALKREGMEDVKDLMEFKDNDLDNAILNFRRPQDIWYPTIPALAGSAEIPPIIM